MYGLLTDPLQRNFTTRGLKAGSVDGTTSLYPAVRKNPVRNQRYQSLWVTCTVEDLKGWENKSWLCLLLRPLRSPNSRTNGFILPLKVSPHFWPCSDHLSLFSLFIACPVFLVSQALGFSSLLYISSLPSVLKDCTLCLELGHLPTSSRPCSSSRSSKSFCPSAHGWGSEQEIEDGESRQQRCRDTRDPWSVHKIIL